MKYKTYNPIAFTVNNAQALGAIKKLTTGEHAITHLPADTRFALAIEAIEKEYNESFSEVNATIAPNITGVLSDPSSIGVGVGANLQMSPEGLVGRFLGYLSLSDTKMRIYKTFDLDVTKKDEAITQPENPELIFEDDISNITSSMQAFQYVLTNNHKKYKLVNVFKIYHTDDHFRSDFGGTQGGLKPLFKYMNEHGGRLKFSQANNIFAAIVIIVVIAFAAYLLLNKH